MKYSLRVLQVTLLAASCTVAQAVPTWYRCDVDATGVTDTQVYYVRLTHVAANPAFEGTWFLVADGAKKEMLAVALAAIAGNYPVTVRADLALSSPIVDRLYLFRE